MIDSTHRLLLKISSGHRPNRGFTIVELLVVISIIALLMAFLLPAMTSARSISKQTVCASQERQIGQLMFNYVATYKQIFPMMVVGDPGSNYLSNLACATTDPDSQNWMQCGLLVPGNSYGRVNWLSSLVAMGGSQCSKIFQCPAATMPLNVLGFSYNMSPGYSPCVGHDGVTLYWGDAGFWYPVRGQNNSPLKYESISSPNDKILVADSGAGCLNYNTNSSLYPALTVGAFYYTDPTSGRPYPVWGSMYLVHQRLSSNNLMLDGSVRNLNFGDNFNTTFNFYSVTTPNGGASNEPFLNPLIPSTASLTLGQTLPANLPANVP